MDVRELRQFVENLSNEKGIQQEVVIEALENAMAIAYRKQLPADPYMDVRVELNFATNDLRAFKVWLPQEERVDEDGDGIDLENADPAKLQKEEIPEFHNSRMAAQAARQVITQRLREARREQMANEYNKRVGELFHGTVKRVTRDVLMVEIDANLEAVLQREHLLPREIFRVNDRVRAVLSDVRIQGRGNQLVLSRTDKRMMQALFRHEVPEIQEDIIEIRAVAREPGVRAKVAVKTNDRRIDPIGACIGLRGSRVQLVSDELGGEKIDIIEWQDNPSDLIINVFSPLQMLAIVVDDEHHSIDVAISADDLAQAIGRNGQNIRLINELTGWRVHVMSEEEMNQKYQDQSSQELEKLMAALDIDEDMASTLLNHGYHTVDVLLKVLAEDLATIPGCTLEIAEELQNRARENKLHTELTSTTDVEIEQELKELPGMEEELLKQLVSRGITTRDELAELATDELCEISSLDEDRAGALIMRAREHWFTAEDAAEE